MERMGAKVGGKRRRGSVEMHGLFASCLALWVRMPQSDATTATAAGASSPRDRHEARLAPAFLCSSSSDSQILKAIYAATHFCGSVQWNGPRSMAQIP